LAYSRGSRKGREDRPYDPIHRDKAPRKAAPSRPQKGEAEKLGFSALFSRKKFFCFMLDSPTTDSYYVGMTRQGAARLKPETKMKNALETMKSRIAAQSTETLFAIVRTLGGNRSCRERNLTRGLVLTEIENRCGEAAVDLLMDEIGL
jgi:hypothetical protein